ncbi:MAG: hypothetical protein QXM68_02010 [Candidatus Aenigmatarchaeota archaeon]|nr:hypothetical protein [Candidatus Aenigmarchaeota archaeon]
MDTRTIRQIRAELVKDKKFRDELSVVLVNDILNDDNMNISQDQVSKKIKKIVDELIRIRFEEKIQYMDN